MRRHQIRLASGAVAPDGPPPLRSDEVPNPWISSNGALAHPDSPQGAGGNGYFRLPGAIDGVGKQSFTIPQPATFRGRSHVLSADDETALEKSKTKPLKVNPPPVTKAQSFKRTIAKNGQNVAVDFEIEILEDATNQPSVPAGHADTGPARETMSFGFSWADIQTDEAKTTVTKIFGVNKLDGKIQLRIRYAEGVEPKNRVAYGRGTTTSDVANGDVSIGFHEHCHLNDWWDYLKTTKLPLKFEGKVGMSTTDYQQKQSDLEDLLQEFLDTGDALTEAGTDEVGNPTRSAYLAK